MGRTLSILLALMFCFSALISCGNEENSSSQSESSSKCSEESSFQSQSENFSWEFDEETESTIQKERIEYKGNSIIVTYMNDGFPMALSDNPFENPWAERYPPFKVELEQAIPCEFEGVTYLGEYVESSLPLGHQAIAHWFQCEDGVSYQVTDTGKLVNIRFTEPNKGPVYKDPQIPYQTDLEVARAFASNYINVEDYEEVLEEKNQGGFAKVAYVKTYNGICTSDYLVVRTAPNGSIIEAVFGTIGEFDGVSMEIDIEKVNADIEARVSSAFVNSGYSYHSLEIAKQMLARTSKNEYVIISRVYPTATSPWNEEVLKTTEQMVVTKLK